MYEENSNIEKKVANVLWRKWRQMRKYKTGLLKKIIFVYLQ